MTTTEQVVLAGQVLWKLMCNFWPVVVLLVGIQLGVWIHAAVENRRRLREMAEKAK